MEHNKAGVLRRLSSTSLFVILRRIAFLFYSDSRTLGPAFCYSKVEESDILILIQSQVTSTIEINPYGRRLGEPRLLTPSRQTGESNGKSYNV